jgi:hypothetical protein
MASRNSSKPGTPPTSLGRLLAWAVDVAGIVSGGIGGGGGLDRDFVSPIVAEVVGIGQFRDALDR